MEEIRNYHYRLATLIRAGRRDAVMISGLFRRALAGEYKLTQTDYSYAEYVLNNRLIQK